MARAPPNIGEARVATNVASPSGMLWSPIASPVRAPILFRLFLLGATTSVTSLNSSGPSGTKSYIQWWMITMTIRLDVEPISKLCELEHQALNYSV